MASWAWPDSLAKATSKLMTFRRDENCRPLIVNAMRLIDCTQKAGTKRATTRLLDVSQSRWMSWIGNACLKQKTVSQSACHNAVVRKIFLQSQGKIPWSGIIFEDIDPADGRTEAYCFRYGISVALSDFPKLMTYQPTQSHDYNCKYSTQLVTVGRYPRPISLHVSTYMKRSGLEGMTNAEGKGNSRWLNEIKNVLTTSMNSTENRFINYWVLENF